MTFDFADIANSMDPKQHVSSSLRAKRIVAWKSVGRGPMYVNDFFERILFYILILIRMIKLARYLTIN